MQISRLILRFAYLIVPVVDDVTHANTRKSLYLHMYDRYLIFGQTENGKIGWY